MKFGKTYEALLTAEWRQQYMNYAELKAMISRGLAQAPDPSTTSNLEVVTYYRTFQNDFLSTCMEELNRVNYFFAQKLAEARRKHDALRIQLIDHSRGGHTQSAASVHEQRHHPVHVRKLRLAASEFYLSLIMLQNFQALNLTGFRKICKKYDKYLKSEEGSIWFRTSAATSDFTKDFELVQMIVEVEDLYTHHLAGGDRAKAMEKLRVPPLGQPTRPLRVFCAGLFLGLFVVGAVICVISYFASSNTQLTFASVHLYRGPLALIVFFFYMALTIQIWEQVGINHVLIFEIDPRDHLEPASVLEIASALGYIYTLSILAFLHHAEFDIKDPYVFPLACLILSFAFVFNPLRIMSYSSRIWLLSVLGRVLAAPMCYVRFTDFWLGDQLTSLSICLVDYYYLNRFYVRYYMNWENTYDFEPDYAVAVIRCLPAWFRFAQCLRRYRDSSSKSINYLLNALKYGLTFVVVTFSTLQMETNANYENMFQNPWVWGYLVSSFIASFYGLCWDLFRDFGLLHIWKGDNFLLRESLVYPKWFYYFAIVQNILLRFVWTLEFYLIYNDILLAYNCKTITCLCEITRRFIWNLLRLEHEHLNNCGKFRATREIFISPLNQREEHLLEHIMDDANKRRSQIDKKYF